MGRKIDVRRPFRMVVSFSSIPQMHCFQVQSSLLCVVPFYSIIAIIEVASRAGEVKIGQLVLKACALVGLLITIPGGFAS